MGGPNANLSDEALNKNLPPHQHHGASFVTRCCLICARRLDSVHSRQRLSIRRSTRFAAEPDTQASRAKISSLTFQDGGLISSEAVLLPARASSAAAMP
jgi:hypothetical protein